MEPLERLDAGHLKAVVTGYRDALRSHQEMLNRLNVYPVPDGDTGTNMALTMESVTTHLDGADDMPAVCHGISHGSLMGARGNSGVILSQVLRGIADRCKEVEAAGPGELADALRSAAEAAYAAVMRPVEGTILTVVRAAAEGAQRAAAAGRSLVEVLDAAREGAARALDETPELLPVLKQAGVVDAGGAGFLLLADALLHVAAGRPLPEPPSVPAAANPAALAAARAGHGEEGTGTGDLRYEVMYFLEAPDEAIDAFKDVWAGLGDSIVVVGGDGLWNCHIHTDDVGAAIEAAIDCGRPRKIRVTDLADQVEEERWVREAGATGEEAGAPHHEHVPTGVIAVATGEGLGRIFRSLGVQRIIAGGQSMNPSTSQIIEAVEAVDADEVVVLPNNKNIVPVAEQAVAVSPKPLAVVPTKSIAEGFAALLEYDPQAPANENAKTMEEAAGRVISAEVTRAVRASQSPAGPIAEGDFLGLSRAGIEVVAPTLAAAATGLLDKLVDAGHEIVTVIEGDGAGPASTRAVTEWLAENRPHVTAEVHHGGQPLYPYLFSIE